MKLMPRCDWVMTCSHVLVKSVSFCFLMFQHSSLWIILSCPIVFCVIHSRCQMCSSVLDFDASPIFMLHLCVMLNMQFFDSCISFLDLALVTTLHDVCDLNAVHIASLLLIL